MDSDEEFDNFVINELINSSSSDDDDYFYFAAAFILAEDLLAGENEVTDEEAVGCDQYGDRYDRYDHSGRHGRNTKLYVDRFLCAHGQKIFMNFSANMGAERLMNNHVELVKHVNLKRDFGFVEFSDPQDADDARRDLDGRKFDGSRIVVEFARRAPRGPGGQREYMGRGPPVSGPCFNCGIDGHWARDCEACNCKNRCYRCGENDHIGRNCQNSPKDIKRGRSYSRSPPPRVKNRSGNYGRSHRSCRSLSPSKDNRGAGHKELLPRSYSVSPSRPSPRVRAGHNGSNHGGSPRRGDRRRSLSPNH